MEDVSIEEGDTLLSESDDVIVGEVRGVREDGVFEVYEVEREMGEYSYHASKENIEEVFDWVWWE